MTSISPDVRESTAGFRMSRPSSIPSGGFGASRPRLRAGRVLGTLVVLFLVMDAAIKLLQLPVGVEGTTQLGYSEGAVVRIGILQVILLGLYLIPRTAVFGAVLWTGYLGGAVATHVLAGNPLFSHVLFPIYVAVFLWGALYLRDERVAAAIALRRLIE